MGLGIPEIIIIGLAIAVLLFGGKKITELARSLGSASGEFKKAKKDVERELKAEEEKAMQNSVSPTSPTESTSDSTTPRA